MKIKVLHISQSLGGVEISIRNIIENINDSKVESFLSTPADTIKVFSKSGKIIQHFKIPLTRNIDLINDIKCFSLIIDLIRNLKPDIIHCHSSKAGFLGRLAGFLLGFPIIYSPRGLSYYSNHSKIINTFFLFLERLASRWTDVFLACSESELEEGKNKLKIKSSKCILWKNNLSEKNFKQYQNQIVPEEYILSIGRPSYQKNPEMLVKVVNELKQIGSPLKFIIAGAGLYSPQFKYLLKLIDKYYISDYLIVKEWTEREEVLRLMAHSLMVVITSRYEGLPLVAIEAMAMGKAIVGTNVLGTKDVIIDQQTGILVQLDDYKAMTEAILRIKNDPVFRNKLEIGSKKEYVENYNTLNRIFALEEIYYSTCLSHRNKL